MKTYEITFITKEEGADKEIKKVFDALPAKITNTSSIGEKQFTYKIKKENKGFYYTFVFETEPDKLAALNKKLQMSDDVLRFLIISIKPSLLKDKTLEKVAKPKEEKIKEKVAEEAPIAEIKEEIKEPVKAEKIEKKETKKPDKKVKTEVKPEKAVPTKVTEIEEETESEEDRLKALDEKLDELLKD
jgi:small subunit ribosomal protein S6